MTDDTPQFHPLMNRYYQPPEVRSMPDNRIYLVWSNEHSGWWRPSHMGYTRYIEEAGRYGYAEAKEIVENANRYLKKGQVHETLMLAPEGYRAFENLMADAIALLRMGPNSGWQPAQKWLDEVFAVKDVWEFKPNGDTLPHSPA